MRYIFVGYHAVHLADEVVWIRCIKKIITLRVKYMYSEDYRCCIRFNIVVAGSKTH